MFIHAGDSRKKNQEKTLTRNVVTPSRARNLTPRTSGGPGATPGRQGLEDKFARLSGFGICSNLYCTILEHLTHIYSEKDPPSPTPA